jgi:pyrroloquinoline-quinone synthase
MTLIDRIDDARARWNVLKHPFYLRWERGELRRRELAHYAGQYRHAVVAVADAAVAAGDADHADEERAHVALWNDFAAAVGAPAVAAPLAATRECARTWRRTEPLEARAVLYAIESGQPEISRTKLDGLITHYGFEAHTPGTSYFELHAELDKEHAARSQAVLAAVDETRADSLAAVAETALRGNWRLLDGVNGSGRQEA